MAAGLEKVCAAVYSASVIDRDTMKAARALLGWNAERLAAESKVSLGAIKDIERGATDPKASTMKAIQDAFEGAGVVILEPGDMRPGGRGVRFKA